MDQDVAVKMLPNHLRINLCHRNGFGGTALIVPAGEGREEVAKLLLTRNVSHDEDGASRSPESLQAARSKYPGSGVALVETAGKVVWGQQDLSAGRRTI